MAEIGSYNSPIKIGEENDVTIEGKLTANIDLGYTVYTALLSHTGVAGESVSAKVLNNTTGATITWSFSSTARYNATADSSIFTEDKTVVFYSLGDNSIVSTANQEWVWISDTEIQFYIGMNADRLLENTSFEIRVYN